MVLPKPNIHTHRHLPARYRLASNHQLAHRPRVCCLQRLSIPCPDLDAAQRHAEVAVRTRCSWRLDAVIEHVCLGNGAGDVGCGQRVNETGVRGDAQVGQVGGAEGRGVQTDTL